MLAPVSTAVDTIEGIMLEVGAVGAMMDMAAAPVLVAGGAVMLHMLGVVAMGTLVAMRRIAGCEVVLVMVLSETMVVKALELVRPMQVAGRWRLSLNRPWLRRWWLLWWSLLWSRWLLRFRSQRRLLWCMSSKLLFRFRLVHPRLSGLA